MTEPDDRQQRMADLEAKLAARRKPEEKRGPDGHASAEIGWRMVTELVAGLGIGLAIGYGIDSVFGTLPIFMVVFCGLGFAAGINVMMRSAKEFQRRQVEAQGGPAGGNDDGAKAPGEQRD